MKASDGQPIPPPSLPLQTENRGEGETVPVDERRMIYMRLDTHPMLPGSIMHYSIAAKTQDDFPGYKDRLNKYKAWAAEGLEHTMDNECPVLINYVQMINDLMVHERHWLHHVEFIEWAMQYAECDIIGFWARAHLKSQTLNKLCQHTAYAVLLTPEPNKGLPFNHHYDEFGKEGSPLELKLAGFRADNKKKLQMRIIKTDGPGINCFYLLDFTNKQLAAVHRRFPTVRIIGITTPDHSNDDDAILAQMHKLSTQQQQHRQQQQQQPPLKK